MLSWVGCVCAAVCVRFPSYRLLKQKYTNRNYFKTSGRLVFHRAPLWWRFVSLDLCLSRLPRAGLPRQKGSVADHADLVRRSEPLPALCLPRNRQRRPAAGRRSHCRLVEVWEEWEEHEGMRKVVKETVWHHENTDAEFSGRQEYGGTTAMRAGIRTAAETIIRFILIFTNNLQVFQKAPTTGKYWTCLLKKKKERKKEITNQWIYQRIAIFCRAMHWSVGELTLPV